MKKVLLILIAMMSIAVSANAINNSMTQKHTAFTDQLIFRKVSSDLVFRTNQNLCCGRDQMILYRSGRFELYQNGIEVYSGTYNIDTENDVVVLDVEGTKLRCKFHYKEDRQNISYLTFGDDTFRPCNR